MKVGVVRGLGGNFGSVENALMRCGADVSYVSNSDELEPVSHVVLPGVGAFAPAMRFLTDAGLADGIRSFVARGGSLLGICLGAQLLFERGAEGGPTSGLAILAGEVQHLSKLAEGRRLPHTGWNWVTFEPGELMVSDDQTLDGYYYFNHEFFVSPTDEGDVVGWAAYGRSFPVAFRNDNVIGFQFHPEKSQELGLEALMAFLSLQVPCD